MGQDPEPDHLIVLVHGLWGNPSHLTSLTKALQAAHSSTIHILVPTSNSTNLTYDGIETGGERVAYEIESTLSTLASSGHDITKFSIIGYSLGGLIARYCIGLLYSRGWFDDGKLLPVNFTAFASPFLGVRTPLKGYHSQFWNALGGHVLSASGTQLFLLDTFRDTGRPLLSVLADPGSIFMQALRKFKRRSLYANVRNDRSVPYYTAYIDACDPYEDLEAVDLHEAEGGYGPTILDAERPVSRKNKNKNLGWWGYIQHSSTRLLKELPFYALFTFLMPVGASVFLVNSGIQSIRSSRRVKLHNDVSSALGLTFKNYRTPLMIEGTVESVQARQPQEHLDSGLGSEEEGYERSEKAPLMGRDEEVGTSTKEREFPTLALAKEQFEMIRNLDAVKWKKYAVNITNVRHTHAAIILRMERESFAEGKTVIRHWIENEFEV